MKKTSLTEALIWVFSLLPAVATLSLYAWLPEQVPLQWGVDGAVSRYGARVELLCICALTVLLQFLMKFSPKLDPKAENYARFRGAYTVLRLTLALFLAFMQGVLLYSCFVPGGLDISRFVTAGVGIMFCVLGNFMPKFKHNYFIGIRTPWTLDNETVWHATHRLAGRVWVVGGLLMIGAVFMPSNRVLFVVILACVVLCGLIPCVYSYYLFQKSK